MLQGLTALDLTDARGQLAGRLLADLGMRVIKAEPPGGDPVRRRGPFKAGIRHPEGSLRFAFLNAGKESRVVSGDADLRDLAGRVDVVLESGPPGALPVAELRDASPGLIVASVTGFGQSGPRAGWLAPDIVGQAMGGLMSISGEPGRPPVSAPGEQGYAFASVAAALGVVLALRCRELTGRGDHVDVSVQEALATQEHLIREFLHGGVSIRREGSQHKHVAPGRIFPCADGHVFLFVSSIHWARFLALWDGHPEEFDGAEWANPVFRRANAAWLDEHVEQFTRRHAKVDLTEHLQANGIPCLPVLSPTEFVGDPQIRGRELFGGVEHTYLGTYTAVRFPAIVDGMRPSAAAPPLIGEGGDLPAPSPPQHVPGPWTGSPGLPLDGVRVVSLTTGIAGPNAARYLANLGAEVIKVESRAGGLDSFRFFSDDVDASPRFLEANLGVRSATINLKEPEGVELFKELVARSDVLVENFRPDVLPRLGLGPGVLRSVRPDLIVARMPGLGTTGPRSLYGTWGPTLAAFSGLTYLWNRSGQGEPVGSQGTYLDYLAGILVPLVVTAALLRRARTGEGALLDLAQVEAAAYVLGTEFLEAAVNGYDPQPLGNADPERPLHGCYPCAGDDRWCVIVCESERQWERLCSELGCAADALDRDAEVARRTAAVDAVELMERLQAAGVACGAVQGGAELATDPHLRARGFVQSVLHPSLGEVQLAGLPLRFSEARTRPYACASPLGADSEEIVCGLLGHTAGQLAAWREARVVY